MRSTAAFGRLEQFHLELNLDVGRAVQRPDAARRLFEKRTERAGAPPSEVSFGPFRLLRTQCLLLEGDEPVPLGSRALEVLIVLLGFAALRAEKTARSSTSTMCPLSGEARTSRPSEISFLAVPTVIETSPSPETAAANPTSLKVTTMQPLTVTEVTLPFLVDDHERPSPDGAAQGSSVQTAAT